MIAGGFNGASDAAGESHRKPRRTFERRVEAEKGVDCGGDAVRDHYKASRVQHEKVGDQNNLDNSVSWMRNTVGGRCHGPATLQRKLSWPASGLQLMHMTMPFHSDLQHTHVPQQN